VSLRNKREKELFLEKRKIEKSSKTVGSPEKKITGSIRIKIFDF